MNIAPVHPLARVVRLDDGPGPRDRAEVLLEVAQTVATELDTTAMLERLAALALEALGAERCAILVTDDASPTLLWPAAAASRAPNPIVRDKFLSSSPIDVSDTAFAPAWGRPGSLAVDDVETSDLIPERWRALGSRSIAMSPLRAGAETFGLVAVDFVSRIHRFEARELDLLDAIGCGAGIALRNARLFSRLTRSVESERRLRAGTDALLAGGSLPQLLEFVIDGFRDLLGATHCAINRLGNKPGSFYTMAIRGWDAPEGERSFSEFPEAEIRCVTDAWKSDPHKILRITDIQTFEAWSAHLPADIGPVLLVPLTVDGLVRGFVVAGRQGPAGFTDHEVSLASAFSDQVGLAIREAELKEALAGRAKAVDALKRLADVIVGTSDLKGALSVLNRGVGADLGLRCDGVAISDPGLRVVLGTAAPTASETALLRDWRRRGAKRMPCQTDDGGWRVPITVSGRVAGVLRLQGSVEGNPAAHGFIQALADGLGEIAYKAKLRRVAQQRGERLAVAAERDRMARDLHDTLGQTLYGLSLRAQQCLALDLADPDGRDEASRCLHDIAQRAGQGVREVRDAVRALAFLRVRSSGIASSLKALVKEFERSTGIYTQLRVSGPSPRRLSEELQGCLYRVAHEALVNVERHSRATGVTVTLDFDPRTARLSIRDDGVGLDQRQAPHWQSAAHLGMRMMSRTVESLGGMFDTVRAEPRGLQILATLPLKQ